MRRHTKLLALAATVVVGLSACSSKKAPPASQGSQTPPASTTAPASPTSPSPQPIATLPSNLPPYNPTIDPANFVDNVTNPYFPLVVGSTYVYEGNRDGVPRRAEVTVAADTKMIMGVKCVVTRDVVTSNTSLVEKTTDWYAQDKDGNVWYFGEDTAEYTNGAVSSTAGTWLAGVDGAQPGIIMQAHPKVGDAYRQEYRPKIAEDYAKVLETTNSAPWPTGNYTNIVVTEDTDLLDATKLEHKSYGPGIGYLGSEGMVNGHHEIVKLTQILKH
jgi:hypothetical protein